MTSIASDFTKLIRRIAKTSKISKERQTSIFRSVERNQADLSVMCFEFFKRFVAFESGQIKQDIQNFILEILYPIMRGEEKKAFTFRVIDEFLSGVHTEFSQKSVLESLNAIGIPEGEIISYMLTKLNIKQGISNAVSQT